MSESAVIYLAIIAVAVAIMAVVQVGVIVVALRSARQLTAAVEDLRREVRPLAEKVHRLTDEATRVTSLARMQVERVDAFLSTTAIRVDDTMSILQGVISGPIRQGANLMTALKAAMFVVRQWQNRSKRPEEQPHDEDALFVG